MYIQQCSVHAAAAVPRKIRFVCIIWTKIFHVCPEKGTEESSSSTRYTAIYDTSSVESCAYMIHIYEAGTYVPGSSSTTLLPTTNAATAVQSIRTQNIILTCMICISTSAGTSRPLYQVGTEYTAVGLGKVVIHKSNEATEFEKRKIKIHPFFQVQEQQQ